ncbi:hypothetical protein PSHT_02962 [Puccinia striiformis]|uniref:Uncharacterized protein n=1 Tax=Puccinia striiformis TaxID=27350 RepID=A0A2S4WGM1_9BASI|nr:hypothetical protein PSHT_02962 [Puccinia striiformis]
MNLSILEAVKVIVQVLRDFELEFAEGWLENVAEKRVYRRRGQSIPNPDIRCFDIATDGESHDDFSETPSTRLK